MTQNEDARRTIEKMGRPQCKPAEGKPAIQLRDVLEELGKATVGEEKRQQLIRSIQELDNNKRKLLVYAANVGAPGSSVNYLDTLPLVDALHKLGHIDNLDLMLQTAGGSGDAAEKIVETCRHHCSTNGEFRVIVPNMAKSAGTLIAIGADRIVMGHCSELGPIDPQITLTVSGVTQQVSAYSFIDARDRLEKKIDKAIAAGQPYVHFLTELGSLDQVFVNHCQHLSDFAQELGKKWIRKRLERRYPDREARKMASETITMLSRVKRHVSHGRFLPARELKEDPKIHLEIDELRRDDEAWRLIWELYIRCEVYLSMEQNRAKLFETENTSMTLG